MAVFPAVFGLLMAGLVTGQITITPKEAVRKVGDSIEILCKVHYPISSCSFLLGTITYTLHSDSVVDEEVMYYGEGEKNGECGVRIRNIKESMNGNISCTLPKPVGSIAEVATMTLTVAKKPQDPQLITPSQTTFIEGDVFKARCEVANGRPAAKISWLLDDEQLLTDLHQPIITTTPGDLYTISQNISRKLMADDQGKTLTCKAEHEDLNEVKMAKMQLSVQYAPKVESTTTTIFGLQLNAEGRLNVTIRSHPPPTAEWQVDGQKLIAPTTSDDGQMTALQPLLLPQGSGFYNVTLILHQIKKEDVDRTYHLRLSNALGEEEVTIRISTMEEPAGVELETGAIVGIVIAVLVLLIAISLIVFAYATDRWCFAGRRRDNTKSSGESTPAGDVLLEGKPLTISDTESAVGGKEKSRLAQLSARVLAALPRKDKVQATESAPHEDEEKPADDKVVYATLALSEQTQAEKPPPAFAEYAEIVYTDQGQKEVKENA